MASRAGAGVGNNSGLLPPLVLTRLRARSLPGTQILRSPVPAIPPRTRCPAARSRSLGGGSPVPGRGLVLVLGAALCATPEQPDS